MNELESYITLLEADQSKIDADQLLLLIQAAKDSRKLSIRRDIILEILAKIVHSNTSPLVNIFSERLKTTKAWRLLANSICSLPELVANQNALGKNSNFKPAIFYPILCDHIFTSLNDVHSNNSPLTTDQKLLMVQLIGRMSLIGQGETVWRRIVLRSIESGRSEFVHLVSDILTLPISPNALTSPSSTFEVFIEPIYIPIFLNVRPSKHSGQLLRDLLSDHILHNETFEFIICNKLILQRSLQMGREQQRKLFFNIFSYLNAIRDCDKLRPSILCRTVLSILDSWSNGTKVILRPHQQSVTIGLAMIIGFRYLFSESAEVISDHCLVQIQSMLMRGIQLYLDRSISLQRDLALCIGEVMLPRLHKFMENRNHRQRSGSDYDGNEDISKLNFDYELTNDCREIKESLTEPIENIFPNPCDKSSQDTQVNVASSELSQRLENRMNDIQESSKKISFNKSEHDAIPQDERHISDRLIKVDTDSDDLKPYEDDSDDETNDICESGTIGEDVISVPIYLRDCINGLAENDKPRYAKLCLIKAGELIRLLHSNHESKRDLNEASSKPDRLEYFVSPKLTPNDSIRDVAIELAQLLLYLEDSFEVDNFNAYRINALTSLCVATPDLAVKFLLDEFNGTRRNFRHQLEILQVLVASAQEISGVHLAELDGGFKSLSCGVSAGSQSKGTSSSAASTRRATSKKPPLGSVNRMCQYACLYFYGICERLNTDVSNTKISPSTILTALDDSADDTSNIIKTPSDVMIRRVISANIKSKAQIDGKNLMQTNILLPFKTSSSSFTTTTKTNSEDFKEESRLGRSRRIIELVDEDGNSNEERSLKGEMSSSQERDLIDDGRSLLRGDDGKIDNSYLLSRIFFSLSMIIRCLDKQPVICRMANDLLDYLAAYRCHPDLGVRKSMVACLSAVRDCTPRVYFEEQLYDKLSHLFGGWLSNELDCIK